MQNNEARKHLTNLLEAMKRDEAQMQEAYGTAIPRSTRARNKKIIEALKTILEAKPQAAKEPTSLMNLIEREGAVQFARFRKGLGGPIGWEITLGCGLNKAEVTGNTLADAVKKAITQQTREWDK